MNLIVYLPILLQVQCACKETPPMRSSDWLLLFVVVYHLVWTEKLLVAGISLHYVWLGHGLTVWGQFFSWSKLDIS